MCLPCFQGGIRSLHGQGRHFPRPSRHIKKGCQLFVGDGKRPFKAAHLYCLQGKEYEEVEALLPGISVR